MILPRRVREQAEKAERGAKNAQDQLEKTKERWAEVRSQATRARELREANGWTEAIADILGGN